MQGEAVGMTPKDDQRSQSPAPLRGDRALADAPSAHLTDGEDTEAERGWGGWNRIPHFSRKVSSNGQTGFRFRDGFA